MFPALGGRPGASASRFQLHSPTVVELGRWIDPRFLAFADSSYSQVSDILLRAVFYHD